MNYYIQGDAAKAEQIKAAFEAKGFVPRIAPMYYGSESVLFFTGIDGYIYETSSPWVMEIIKTHPNYQELQLSVEPNFKVGDWIINKFRDICLITDIDLESGYYFCESNRFGNTDGDIDLTDKAFHLWSIQDAKDGDVLVTTKIRNCPFIYRKTDYNNDLAYYYAGVDGDGNFCEGCLKRTLYHFGSVENVVPATKEQRDLLFAKMREAGYEWDADKKELRKIQQHYDISNFKPFDKVLVRDDDDEPWRIAFYGYYNKEAHYSHFVGTCWGKQCIPYNDDTKHLLGTTDMPSEEYINW